MSESQPAEPDLVERARYIAKWGIPDFTNSHLLEELANEIERLRRANELLIAGVKVMVNAR